MALMLKRRSESLWFARRAPGDAQPVGARSPAVCCWEGRRGEPGMGGGSPRGGGTTLEVSIVFSLQETHPVNV